MSCLSLDELSLSEQAAVAGSFAAAVERRYAAQQSVLWPSSGPSDTSLSVTHGYPWPNASDDGHTSLSHSEDTSMVEKQVTNHPPLQICGQGHRPYMYQASGNRQVVYYVECSQCRMQTKRFDAPEAAASAWARRDVSQMVGTANHAAVAA